MIVKGKIRDYNKKIDNLIQSVIVNYSQDIDFNNEIELYDRLIYLLTKQYESVILLLEWLTPL